MRLSCALLLALAACSNAPARPAPTCTDQVKNGNETDVDCGGSCSPCAEGKSCGAATDCVTGYCNAGNVCASKCTDGIKDNGETDVDCGGPCAPCADGKACTGAADCKSALCIRGACSQPSCTDGVKDGTETDVDCGGSCNGCADGKSCVAAKDCANGYCNPARLCASKCTDGIKDNGETDVDCGGPCAACADGKGCAAAKDCTSGYCNPASVCASKCTDGIKDNGETDVDCGGPCPTACRVGQGCIAPSDCTTGVCNGSACGYPATCSDGVKNGTETDVDCGGPSCPACVSGLACAAASDCAAGFCSGGVCGKMASSAAQVTVLTSLYDGAGALHAFTLEGYTGACPTQLVDHRWSGGSWTSTVIDTTTSPTSMAGVQGVVTSTGEMVLTYLTSQYCFTNGGTRYQDAMYFALNKGSGWSHYQADSSAGPMISGSNEYQSGGGWDMSADGNDAIHALVSYYPNYRMVYYKWTLDAAGKPQNALGAPGYTVFYSSPSGSPQIRADEDGQLHAVYHAYYNSNPVYYRSSTDGGVTWSAAEPVETKGPNDYAIAVSAWKTGAGKQVYVAHQSGATGKTTVLLRQDATHWIVDETVPTSGFAYPHLFAVGGALKLSYLAPPSPGAPNNLMTVQKVGSAWGAPVNLDRTSSYGDTSFAFPNRTWPLSSRPTATLDVVKEWQAQVSPSSWLLLRDSF